MCHKTSTRNDQFKKACSNSTVKVLCKEKLFSAMACTPNAKFETGIKSFLTSANQLLDTNYLHITSPRRDETCLE